LHNTRKIVSKPESVIRVLTEEDVVKQIRLLILHGYGQLEVQIEDGYIRRIKPTPMILGCRP